MSTGQEYYSFCRKSLFCKHHIHRHILCYTGITWARLCYCVLFADILHIVSLCCAWMFLNRCLSSGVFCWLSKSFNASIIEHTLILERPITSSEMCLLYMKYVLDHMKSLRGNDQPAHQPANPSGCQCIYCVFWSISGFLLFCLFISLVYLSVYLSPSILVCFFHMPSCV